MWGKGDHALQTCLSHLWGRGTTPLKLASHRSSGGGGPRSGGGGVADWRHYKKLRRSRHHYPLNPGRGAAHPAAPFRLAALATHPREGGGQVTWRRRTLPQTLPIPFCGEGYHAFQTCLPPLVGGRGTTKWWRGAAEGGIIKKLAAKPPPPPSEPGPQSGPSSRPLPSRCARHPPPGRGWAGNIEEKNVALKPCLSHFVGERRPRPSNLPPTARRGEGDHEVVEGGRRRRHNKTHRPQGDNTTLGPKGRQTLEP